MNSLSIREACLELGHVEPINIESSGQVWLGNDPANPQFLTQQQQSAVIAKTQQIVQAYLDSNPAPVN